MRFRVRGLRFRSCFFKGFKFGVRGEWYEMMFGVSGMGLWGGGWEGGVVGIWVFLFRVESHDC